MKVTKETVERVATLAALKLSETEKEYYQAELQKILDLMNELDAVDCEGVDPLVNPLRGEKDTELCHEKWRSGEVKESRPVEEILSNTAEKALNQFKLNAVLENEE